MLRFHPHHSTLPTAHMLLLQYPLLYVMRGLADHRCAGVVLLTVQTVLYSERVICFEATSHSRLGRRAGVGHTGVLLTCVKQKML